MKIIKDNRETFIDNIDIIGIILIAIATLLLKRYSTVLYTIAESLGASLVFARMYIQFKLANTKYDKTFYGLAMAGIMIACVSIFNW